MDLEKYTERSKGFVQSAQSLALRSGHQRLTPEHLLKVLLEDKEGLCANLIRAAGGDPKAALAAVDAELDKQPKVEGSGAGQVYMSPELARVFDQAEKIAEKAGDSFVTVERLLLALAMAKETAGGEGAGRGPGHPAKPQPRDRRGAQGPQGRQRLGRGRLRRAEEIRARPDRGGARGQARSGHRPRRGNPPHDPGAVAPHQEQSGADRRARRRQDRDRRGAGAAHRQRRRAGEPQEQEAAGARSRRACSPAPNTAASSRSA